MFNNQRSNTCQTPSCRASLSQSLGIRSPRIAPRPPDGQHASMPVTTAQHTLVSVAAHTRDASHTTSLAATDGSNIAKQRSRVRTPECSGRNQRRAWSAGQRARRVLFPPPTSGGRIPCTNVEAGSMNILASQDASRYGAQKAGEAPCAGPPIFCLVAVDMRNIWYQRANDSNVHRRIAVRPTVSICV